MPAPTNLIKSRLQSGDMQLGAWLNLASPVGTEILAGAGYDWCLIDAEHGGLDTRDVRQGLMALAAVGCPAAVRVAANEGWLLKQVLDLGAQTVLVPMVGSGAEAQAAADAVRYPPDGARGLAAGVVRASGYGATPDYATSANAQICLMVQAETRAAVDDIDAIAAVEGVDCVFVGPSDLAADMGYLGDTGAAEVQEAIAHIMARTRAAGKAVGMFCLNPDDLQRYADLGARFITVASDVNLLRTAATGRLAAARASLKS
ncbi:MAG: HpcH/HpaI aldolase/citrate lyase family protein [Pseudomonadota bacterium]